MFHNRHRHRHPLADFIPWSDYRVNGMPPPIPGLGRGFGYGFGRGPWGYRRRSQLGRLLVGLAILVAVIYLFQRLVNPRNRSAWF